MTLALDRFGVEFRNPVLLAAGTAGFGEELVHVMDLSELGGLVTKSVTVEPRDGNPAPRVSEFDAGMINSIGLANPGLEGVRREKLPWMRDHLAGTHVFVSVAGGSRQDYLQIVSELDGEEGFLGYELNLSCPNDRALHGLPFALDPDALADVVSACRARTERPLLVKLAPNAPDMGASARTAVDAGADGVTVVNTLPGLVVDPDSGQARLGAGPGGMSGPALRPVGVHAAWRAAQAVDVPIVGVGGIFRADDALQYLRAGASLVQVGTASFADPRAALRVVNGLARRLARLGIRDVESLIGTVRIGPATEAPNT